MASRRSYADVYAETTLLRKPEAHFTSTFVSAQAGL